MHGLAEVTVVVVREALLATLLVQDQDLMISYFRQLQRSSRCTQKKSEATSQRMPVSRTSIHIRRIVCG